MSLYTTVPLLDTAGGTTNPHQMGAWLRDVDRRTNAEVAIRRLCAPVWLSDDERSERLRQLAGAIEPQVELRHPNLAAVRQVQIEGEAVLVTRDYVAGMSLADHVLRHGPLSCDQVTMMAGQIASGLDTLARSGFTHGALTSRNVLLTPRGDVSVTDAGIRQAAAARFALAGRSARYLDAGAQADDVRAFAHLLCCMLAGVPSGSAEALNGALYRLPMRGRIALERALDRGTNAFDLALPLAQMLDPARHPSLWQIAWRPAAAAGVFAVLATLPGSALPEQEQHRPQPVAVEATAVAPAPAKPARPLGEQILSKLSADDIEVLRSASRRMGPAMLARPVVADVFDLTDVQRERIQVALDAHRKRVDQVVNSAAAGIPINTGAAMSDARAATCSRILSVLDQDQRAAWEAVASDSDGSCAGF